MPVTTTSPCYQGAIVANAIGMGVARRGTLGPTVEEGTHLRDAAALFR